MFSLDLDQLGQSRKTQGPKDTRPPELKQKILGSEARFSKKRYFATWIADDPLNIDRCDEEVGEGIIEVLSSDDDPEGFEAPLNDTVSAA